MMIGTMLILTACGTTEETQQGPGTGEEMVMDGISELMAGTMLLETTNYPLDKEQQSTLLLLWKGYSAVVKSSTSADAEISALEEQIKAVFTKDQITAIDAMGLTSETLTTKLSEVGIIMGGPSTEGTDQAPGDMMQMPMGGGEMPSGGNGQNLPNSDNRFSGGGGGMPSGMGGGGMPGGMSGGMMMGGGQSSITGETGNSEISQQATLMANSLSSITSRTTNTMLLNLVIQYLNGVVRR